ncbi:MAG TPA: LysM peptidoglycan-binding domain-containing protein [Phototrophicaceae bacterium]|nr:LysM peptidoglycan-binding domain-containing protein [Phototrophicaceae bacterium]
MPQRLHVRAFLIVLAGGLFSLACNLTATTSLTPTPQPGPTSQVVTSISPTLFASITPLVSGGGGTSPTSAAPTSGTCTPPANWVQYTIADGDSLAALAQATGTSVQAIVQANCLPDADTIYSGQVIYLPTNPVSG